VLFFVLNSETTQNLLKGAWFGFLFTLLPQENPHFTEAWTVVRHEIRGNHPHNVPPEWPDAGTVTHIPTFINAFVLGNCLSGACVTVTVFRRTNNCSLAEPEKDDTVPGASPAKLRKER
jgi:hypothetical protein